MAAAFAAAETLERDRIITDPWAHSPHKWLVPLVSKRKGRIGEEILSDWLTRAGFTVAGSRHQHGDRTVNGHHVEMKLSTEWENGIFRWSQIRDQHYGHLMFLGIRPQALHLWFLPKQVGLERSEGQHSGKDATETRWLAFPANDHPTWAAPYGGDLDTALGAVTAALTTPAADCCIRDTCC